MAEFVKKTIVGYKVVAGGQSDSECSHAILTLEEYNKLLQDIRNAESEEQKTKTEASFEIANVKSKAASDVRKALENAEERISDIQDALDEESRQNAYQKRLNANLLRISKERANSERKLKPKKTHTGYVVISSTEKPYRYKLYHDIITVMFWETILQSPYTIDFSEEQVKEQTKELLRKDVEDRWIISKIGINAHLGGSYESMIEDENWGKYNVLLELRYRANYRMGYWELVLTHTKALSIVPADMRP